MTYPSEKFCLKWNDFQQNILSFYGILRNDSDFSDVTLVCEEDTQVEAHRIILTACSSFFHRVLKRNKHSHPMIYMRGFKAKDLNAIVDFIYHGEANVFQDDLDRFLALAEDLQLKGLSSSKSNTEEPIQYTSAENPKQKPRQNSPKQEILAYEASTLYTIVEESVKEYVSTNEHKSIVPIEGKKLSLASDTNQEDLKATIGSMMERVIGEDYKFKCNVCGKTTTDKTVMSRHVETHIEGLSYPCNICGKVSRSSGSFIMHYSRYHKN